MAVILIHLLGASRVCEHLPCDIPVIRGHRIAGEAANDLGAVGIRAEVEHGEPNARTEHDELGSRFEVQVLRRRLRGRLCRWLSGRRMAQQCETRGNGRRMTKRTNGETYERLLDALPELQAEDTDEEP